MSAGNWFNSDGLYLEFGTTKAVVETAGNYKVNGELNEVFLDLDLTTLTSTPAIVSNTYKFPTGMRIQEIVVVTHTAATGTSTSFDLGLQREDRSTQIDYDGLLAAFPKTSCDAVGEQTTVTVGGTGAGALLGTATTQVGYLTANTNASTFSAGNVRVRIRYYGFGTITQ